MGAAIGTLALDVIEKAAPVIIAAMTPEIQSILAKLPPGTVKVVPPAIGVEVAVASNLAIALPAFSAGIYKTICAKIGVAVAIYATEHQGDNLQSDIAWIDIQAMAIAAIGEEGLDTTKIPRSTMRQMVASGIELHRAGAGTKALTVETWQRERDT
jgi:hypothetical protein